MKKTIADPNGDLEKSTAGMVSANFEEKGIDFVAGEIVAEPEMWFGASLSSSDDIDPSYERSFEEKILAAELGFFDGYLYDKSIDKRIRGNRHVSGVLRTPEQIVYFAITGKWFDEVERIDPDRGLSYDNLIHPDFCLESSSSLPVAELDNYFGFDPEASEIFWRYSKNHSGLRNSVMEGQSIVIRYAGYRLVNWCGKIFMYESIAAPYLSGYEGADSLGEVPSVDEIESINASDSYGRNAKICCFYCGDHTSITRDHVIPVSSNSGPRTYNSKDTVPCCTECNSLLGARFITTVEERACYLAERIASRYRSCLASADFSETEILQFGPRLKSTVLANIHQKKFTAQRISHCHEVAGSLYDPEKVSHLRGVTTYAKKLALNIITEYVYGDESADVFAQKWAAKLDVSKSEVSKILNEKLHVDVAIQFKFDQGLNLAASIHQCAKLLRPR